LRLAPQRRIGIAALYVTHDREEALVAASATGLRATLRLKTGPKALCHG
jgi:ABC-type sugar transport system ATPase subunit